MYWDQVSACRNGDHLAPERLPFSPSLTSTHAKTARESAPPTPAMTR